MSTTKQTKDLAQEPVQEPEVVVSKQTYFLPEYSLTVEATSPEDAKAQAEQLIAKKEGDGNI